MTVSPMATGEVRAQCSSAVRGKMRRIGGGGGDRGRSGGRGGRSHLQPRLTAEGEGQSRRETAEGEGVERGSGGRGCGRAHNSQPRLEEAAATEDAAATEEAAAAEEAAATEEAAT